MFVWFHNVFVCVKGEVIPWSCCGVNLRWYDISNILEKHCSMVLEPLQEKTARGILVISVFPLAVNSGRIYIHLCISTQASTPPSHVVCATYTTFVTVRVSGTTGHRITSTLSEDLSVAVLRTMSSTFMNAHGLSQHCRGTAMGV